MEKLRQKLRELLPGVKFHIKREPVIRRGDGVWSPKEIKYIEVYGFNADTVDVSKIPGAIYYQFTHGDFKKNTLYLKYFDYIDGISLTYDSKYRRDFNGDSVIFKINNHFDVLTPTGNTYGFKQGCGISSSYKSVWNGFNSKYIVNVSNIGGTLYYNFKLE